MVDADKWGIPFFHRSKKGGWFYQMGGSPKSDSGTDWPDEMTFGSNSATMHPNGPTDFGLGKNIAGFSDSIGGCKMNFADTAQRGYAYKKDDARDIEFKCVADFSGIDSGFSISACTGHHTGDGCCQGFAYMGTVEVNDSPSGFRFRKEMWHVNYDDSPEGDFTHSKFNFKINGHGPVGLGFCRYNKRKDPTKDDGENDQIILEYWGNPTPDDNTKWVMLKRITDQKGNGWGDGGDKCNGAKDQHGPWSNAQSRMKTNSSGGTIKFTKVSLREIDEFKYYGETDTGGGGTGGGDNTPSLEYTYESKFGSQGNGNGQFQDPHDITFLGNGLGDFFVCDRVRNDVQRFTHTGTYVSKFGGSGSGNGQFNVPYAVEHDGSDNLYVCDRENNRVQKLTSAGVYISKITSAGGKNFVQPEDIVFDYVTGDMFICDTGNNRICKFDKDHKFLKQWGSKGTGNGQFDHPHSSDIGPDRKYYVSSGNQGYIQVFDLEGNFIRRFGTPGNNVGQLLTFLEHMDIDTQGRLHIVNNDARAVVLVYDSVTGHFLTEYGTGTSGSANGQFKEAEHVTCDGANKPYVVDAKNQRIQIFSINAPPTDPTAPPPPPIGGSETLRKTFRDFFNINTSPAQSCSGISAGVLPFVNVYSETLGTTERKLQDIPSESNRTRVAVLAKTSSQLIGKKPRRFIIPLKKVNSPGGNIRCVIWDGATSPEGGNEVVVLGSLSVSSGITADYTDITFYNEAAPLSLPNGMLANYRIGVEYLGTSDADWITAKYNSDVVNGGNTMYSAYQMTAPDPKKWTDYASRDLTCRIET